MVCGSRSSKAPWPRLRFEPQSPARLNYPTKQRGPRVLGFALLAFFVLAARPGLRSLMRHGPGFPSGKKVSQAETVCDLLQPVREVPRLEGKKPLSRPARAGENALAGHPLPKGEGFQFQARPLVRLATPGTFSPKGERTKPASLTAPSFASCEKTDVCHPERSEGSRQFPMVRRFANNYRDPSLRSG